MRILYSPDGDLGNGAPVTSPPAQAPAPVAPVTQQPAMPKEGQMPEHLRGTSVNLEEIEMEFPSIKDENFNKSTTPDAKIVTKPAEGEVTPVTPPAKATEKGKLPALPEIKKPEVAAPVPPKPGEKPVVPKGQRDYSKFDAADVPFLKQCTNEAFAHFEKKLPALHAENKELKEKWEAHVKDPNAVPANWHNHPQAFTLHPQFQKAYESYQRVGMEKNIYNEMLISLETAGTFRPLKGYSNDGSPVFGEEVDLSKDANALARQKLQVQNWVNQAASQENQYAGGLQQFQNQFAQRYATAERYSKDIVAEKYPWYTDPAKKDDPRHKDQQMFMEAVPEEFKDHPSTVIASLLWTSIAEWANAYGELAKQNATGQALTKIQEEVEPSVGSTPSPNDNTAVVKIPGIGRGKVYAGPKTFNAEDGV